jgi:hypothetical protein
VSGAVSVGGAQARLSFGLSHEAAFWIGLALVVALLVFLVRRSIGGLGTASLAAAIAVGVIPMQA